jgi:5-methyltetrahydropteroyltriglutamate--homocysteine methyltransferase
MSRILVTHAGSLIRPNELLSFLSAIDNGQPDDGRAYAAALHSTVTAVVRNQLDAAGCRRHPGRSTCGASP